MHASPLLNTSMAKLKYPNYAALCEIYLPQVIGSYKQYRAYMLAQEALKEMFDLLEVLTDQFDEVNEGSVWCRYNRET